MSVCELCMNSELRRHCSRASWYFHGVLGWSYSYFVQLPERSVWRLSDCDATAVRTLVHSW